MTERRFTFSVHRFKPGVIDPPIVETEALTLEEELTVIDALEALRLSRIPGLMYRHSCHHGACGTCAVRINGLERLACTTTLKSLETDEITLEPIRGHRVLGDLVVDTSILARDIDEGWSQIRPSNRDGASRLEDCIECGICMAVCDEAGEDKDFIGPIALAALNRRLETNPDEEEAILAVVSSPRGEKLCLRHIDCSRHCPTKVSPAKHIADLRRRLASKTS